MKVDKAFTLLQAIRRTLGVHEPKNHNNQAEQNRDDRPCTRMEGDSSCAQPDAMSEKSKRNRRQKQIRRTALGRAPGAEHRTGALVIEATGYETNRAAHSGNENRFWRWK
jgi:hypothetical protein